MLRAIVVLIVFALLWLISPWLAGCFLFLFFVFVAAKKLTARKQQSTSTLSPPLQPVPIHSGQSPPPEPTKMGKKRRSQDASGTFATANQLLLLKSKGVAVSDDITKAEASKLIDGIIRKGLATERQKSYLEFMGLDVPSSLTEDQAAALIGNIPDTDYYLRKKEKWAEIRDRRERAERASIRGKPLERAKAKLTRKGISFTKNISLPDAEELLQGGAPTDEQLEKATAWGVNVKANLDKESLQTILEKIEGDAEEILAWRAMGGLDRQKAIRVVAYAYNQNPTWWLKQDMEVNIKAINKCAEAIRILYPSCYRGTAE